MYKTCTYTTWGSLLHVGREGRDLAGGLQRGIDIHGQIVSDPRSETISLRLKEKDGQRFTVKCCPCQVSAALSLPLQVPHLGRPGASKSTQQTWKGLDSKLRTVVACQSGRLAVQAYRPITMGRRNAWHRLILDPRRQS